MAQKLQRASYCRVVVPSKTSASRLLSLDLWTGRILDVLLPLSRGATEIDARGHWLDKSQRRVSEAVRLLDVHFLQGLSVSASRLLVAHFETWAALMDQEALAVVVGQRMHLIYPHERRAILPDTESRRHFLRTIVTQNAYAGGAVSDRPAPRQRRSQ